MNKLTIIGNLTNEPDLRVTQNGTNVCSFTVAVNRRKTQANQNPEADFFKVTAWRERGELCAKFLAKGKKVCVIGPVSVSVYTGHDGTTKAQLEITADEVEFLSPKISDPVEASAPRDAQTGYEQVETSDFPF